MNGPFISEHGDVISSALQAQDHYHKKAQDALFDETRVYRGQIQVTIPIDDSDNDDGVFTLYDVLIFKPDGTTELIRRCRALQPLYGGTFNNFLEVLPPDNGDQSEDLSIGVANKPGTHVLVAFISGHRNQAVILGGLPHPNEIAVNSRPTSDLSPHLEGEFQGFNWMIDQNGAMLLTFNGPRDETGALVDESIGPTEVEIDLAGNIRIENNENMVVRIDREQKTIEVNNGDDCTFLMEQTGNKVTVACDEINLLTTGDCNITTEGKTVIKATDECQVSSDSMILLSKTDGSADEPFVLGNKLVAYLGDLCDAIAQIKHLGNLGSPTPPPINAPAFAALSARAKELLSELIMGTK